MTVYTFSKARQKLAALLEKAKSAGEVRIKRKDGQEFVVKPASKKDSPLDIDGIDLGIDSEEFVDIVHGGGR